ncbi:hypothetical protein CMI37_17205 [Candidatus Pacearchaeota archaeon]|nr:hypothetical protein [Candidatus Pacearchaeota archaeon]
MANPTRIEGDMFVAGNISSRTMAIPDGTVINADVSASAAIAATKMEHRHQVHYSQEVDTTAADEGRVIHVVYGSTGSIVAVEAGCVIANIGDSTVTVDLHNNGASILTAPISIDSGDAAYAIVAGSIDTAALADDDVLEVIIDATVGGGTLGKGLFVSVIISEDAA